MLNPEAWRDLARLLVVDAANPKLLEASAFAQAVRERITGFLRGFSAHVRVPEVWLALEPWSIENGPITLTMKLKRPAQERRFAEEIRKLLLGKICLRKPRHLWRVDALRSQSERGQSGGGRPQRRRSNCAANNAKASTMSGHTASPRSSSAGSAASKAL